MHGVVLSCLWNWTFWKLFWQEIVWSMFQKFKIWHAAAAAAKSLQSCPTLCDPIDGSPPGSPVPGILRVRVLEWDAISFSNAWKWKWKWICSVVSNSYLLHGLQPTRLFHPWDFPGKSTGVGCHCLLRKYGIHYVYKIVELKEFQTLLSDKT